jgi:hypothetical protein
MKELRKEIIGALAILLLACFVAVPVAADDYYKGVQKVTKLDDTVSGGVDVEWFDSWESNPTDVSHKESSTQFTLDIDGGTLEFARLYVVTYLGNMNADYFGNLTVNVEGTDVADHYPLDLSYIRAEGANFSDVSEEPYFVSLSRVTSDYVAVFDITDLATGNESALDVEVETWNVSGKFDGRFKEIKVVYGWNDGDEDEIHYWVNEGHDPITKYTGTYTDNKTWFNGATIPEDYVAKLWVDYLASSGGQGTYTWNDESLTGMTITQGRYAGINYWSWNSGKTMNTDNFLTYSNTSSYYKNIVDVLVVQED